MIISCTNTWKQYRRYSSMYQKFYFMHKYMKKYRRSWRAIAVNEAQSSFCATGYINPSARIFRLRTSRRKKILNSVRLVGFGFFFSFFMGNCPTPKNPRALNSVCRCIASSMTWSLSIRSVSDEAALRCPTNGRPIFCPTCFRPILTLQDWTKKVGRKQVGRKLGAHPQTLAA